MVERKAQGLPVTQNSLYRVERFAMLMQQTQQQIQGYARQLAPQIEEEQQRLWGAGQEAANDQLASVVGSFNRLPVQSTNTIIGTTADGSPLLNVLRGHWPIAVDGIVAELVRGVALGVNPRVVARRAATAAQASLKQMLTVARTEQLRAYREASRDIYKRSGVVKQYKRLAAKNNRTCVLCIADDGHIYQVDEPLPLHPNCRCTSIPVVDGYKIDTGKTGAEWFAAQSVETQRAMLGKSRYEMYKNGTPLSAFLGIRNHPDWGPNLTKLTIDKIGKTAVQFNHGELARAKLASILDTIHDRVKPIREQITKLGDEADKAFAAGDHDRVEKLFQKITSLWKKVNKGTNNDAYQKEIDNIIYQDSKSGFGLLHMVKGTAPSKSDQKEWAKGVDAFGRMIGDKLMDNTTVVFWGSGDADRAYALVGDVKHIYIFKNDKPRTVVHELGHVLEHHNPQIQQAAFDFLNRRTRGETPVPLKKYSDFYGDDEMTTPDNFTSPYVGKRYQHKSTEVVSMGLEYMYADPVQFAKDDPDYFDFIYNLVRNIRDE